MQRRVKPQGKAPKKSSRKIVKQRRATRVRKSRVLIAKNDAESCRLERSLSESEARYGLVTEAVAEGIYDWNIELNTLFVSPRLMEIFNFERAGLKSSADWVARVHPDDLEGYSAALRTCFKQRLAKFECEYRIKAADGNYLWVEDHGRPVHNEAGRTIRLVGAVSDISRRHQAERALRDREHELNAVLDTIDYGILFMGPDLRAKLINRAFRRIWNISDEFIRDTRPTMRDLMDYVRRNDLYDVPPDLFEEYAENRVEAVRKGATTSSEMRLRDGRVIHLQIRALPDGGRMLTYFDITDLKRSEETAKKAREVAETALVQLRVAQDRLVQTEKLASLGQLTAGIAHEIKNPLNFVNNFSALSAELVDELCDVLAEASLEAKRREELDEIRELLKSNLEKVVQHGKRADSIVKNMLLHSRSGAGEQRSADVIALVDESLNLAYHGARAERQGFNITLEREFDPETGAAEVFPQEITRVFLNLISNGFYAATRRAAEASNGFQPVLKAVTRNLGDRVEIRIRDNGTGIPPDVKDKIFNPFFTTKPAGEGTGLGLSMSHDIVVKQHGGTIDLETEPGAFTEFIITLPRRAPRPDATGGPNN
jgi:PAS domain S-box-containing protein